MKLRMAVVISALVASVSLPAIAQEQHALLMKYAAGDQRPMRITMTGIGTLTVQAPGAPNQPMDLWMNANIDCSQEVKSVDERGVADLEWKLQAMNTDMQFMGQRMSMVIQDGHLQMLMNDQLVFDSLDPELAKQNPMLGLIGQGFIIRQDQTGKVVGLPQFELLLKMLMPDSDFKTAMEQSTGPLPPGPVKVGDIWEERQVWPYSVPEGMQRPVFINHRTFAVVENVAGRQCAKITSKSEAKLANLTMSVPMFMMGQVAGGAAPVSVTINEMALAVTGTEFFDIERGFPLKADTSMTLNMSMTQKMRIAQPQQPGAQPPAPGTEQPQEIEIGISIQDLVMDMTIESAQ